jgi:hypothetical protein
MSFSSNSDQQNGGGEQTEQDLSSALNETSDGNFVLEENTPKRQVSAGTLAVGGLIAACAAVVYFMYLRNGPQAANASDATAAANSTITQFLSADGENVEKMKQMLKDTEKAVQQFQNHPAKSQVPLDNLRTNPFRQVTTELGNKAEEKAAEEAAKRKREETLKAVQSLRVQSIIAGGARKAVMINNKMYTEGEEVDRFVVEKIKSGSVIVRFEKSRFELKMQK